MNRRNLLKSALLLPATLAANADVSPICGKATNLEQGLLSGTA